MADAITLDDIIKCKEYMDSQPVYCPNYYLYTDDEGRKVIEHSVQPIPHCRIRIYND